MRGGGEVPTGGSHRSGLHGPPTLCDSGVAFQAELVPVADAQEGVGNKVLSLSEPISGQLA